MFIIASFKCKCMQYFPQNKAISVVSLLSLFIFVVLTVLNFLLKAYYICTKALVLHNKCYFYTLFWLCVLFLGLAKHTIVDVRITLAGACSLVSAI